MIGDVIDESRLKELANVARARASFVGAFDPLDFIPSGLDDDAEGWVLNALAADIDEVPLDRKILWKLTAGARHRELRKAVIRKDYRALLDKARPLKNDVFGQYLVELLRGRMRKPDFRKMTRLQLQEFAVAQDFANDVANHPAPSGSDDPRFQLARIDDRERLQHVAPKLVGRRLELRALHDYAVRGKPLSSPFEVFPAPKRSAKKLEWLRPTLVTGIGGCGKSALIAELVKTVRRDDWSGPITVLLDFDRPNISLGAEREWTSELTRQIGRARPELDKDLDALRRESVFLAKESHTDLHTVTTMLERLSHALAAQPGRHDLLIVIDTFEEVIVQSNMSLDGRELDVEQFGLLLSWIDSLNSLVSPSGGKAFRNVRAVVAGRVKPFAGDKVRLAPWFAANVEIGFFEKKEVAEFLQLRGPPKVFTPARAIRVANRGQWYPLLLLILIRFSVGRTAKEIDDMIDEKSETGLHGTEAALRVFYSRFLDRVKDHRIGPPGHERIVKKEDLKRLAHPGLALKVVNAELICNVLSGPCGLGQIWLAQAQDLLAALSREAWLVEPDGPGQVRHISNVRRVMLPMLCGGPESSEDDNVVLQKVVREVQHHAAEWYEAKARTDPEARTLAAYYRAFLNDVGQIADNDQLARQVSFLAGEDIRAMPIKARAILIKEAASGRSLSIDETAALPEAHRRKVASQRRQRRVKSGVVKISSGRPAETENAIDDLENDQSLETRSGSFRRSVNEIIEDDELSSQVSMLFNAADFFRLVKVARPALLELGDALRDHVPSSLSEGLTKHWMWKWALANQALGGDREVPDALKLDRFIHGPPGWTRQFAPLLAIARVAASDRSYLETKDYLQDRPDMATVGLDAMRLMSLDITPLPRSSVRIPISLMQVFAPAIWEKIDGGTAPFELPSDLSEALMALRKQEGPLRSYLSINEAMGAKGYVQSGFSMNRRELARSFVRGRTPELYDPIRAALIDLFQYEPKPLRSVLNALRSKTPIWPQELEPARLMTELQKTRQADFLLSRLIEFLDVCCLLRDFLERCAQRTSLERTRQVTNLFASYDQLLLGGNTTSVWL